MNNFNLLLVLSIFLFHNSVALKQVPNEYRVLNETLNLIEVFFNQTKEQNGQISINEETRKKQDKKDMMSKILPLMVLPFMVSTGMIPMMLVSLKFMLAKGILVGKIAIILLLLNMFRSRTYGDGGVYNHNMHERDSQLPMAHYGYNGNEEYGAYIN